MPIEEKKNEEKSHQVKSAHSSSGLEGAPPIQPKSKNFFKRKKNRKIY